MMSTSEASPMHAAEIAVKRTLASALTAKPHGESFSSKGVDMRWRSADGLTAALVHIAEHDEGVRVGVTITSPERDDTAVLRPERIADAPILERLAELFPSPKGRILWNDEKDGWGNEVSIILLPDGRRLRMVRHEPKKPWHRTVRSTIYRGRGNFVRVSSTAGRNDCCYDELVVAGYAMLWGDGEIGPFTNAENGPDLEALVTTECAHQGTENAILTVLGAIVDVDAVWETKDVAPRLAA
jgi:hypothetical protein